MATVIIPHFLSIPRFLGRPRLLARISVPHQKGQFRIAGNLLVAHRSYFHIKRLQQLYVADVTGPARKEMVRHIEAHCEIWGILFLEPLLLPSSQRADARASGSSVAGSGFNER